MHADHTRDPARRRRRRRQLDRGVDELDEAHLTATPAARLERAQEATLEQLLPGSIAEPTDLVVRDGRRGQRRSHLPRRFQEAIA
jgi:hypothetical protein